MYQLQPLVLYYLTVSSIEPIFHGRCQSNNSIIYDDIVTMVTLNLHSDMVTLNLHGDMVTVVMGYT